MSIRKTSVIVVCLVLILSTLSAQAQNMHHTLRTRTDMLRAARAVEATQEPSGAPLKPVKLQSEGSSTGATDDTPPERNDVGWIVFSVISGVFGVGTIGGFGYTMLCIPGRLGKGLGLLGVLVGTGMTVGFGVGAKILHDKDNAWRP